MLNIVCNSLVDSANPASACFHVTCHLSPALPPVELDNNASNSQLQSNYLHLELNLADADIYSHNNNIR